MAIFAELEFIALMRKWKAKLFPFIAFHMLILSAEKKRLSKGGWPTKMRRIASKIGIRRYGNS
jgi:hypothetical protein